MRAGQWRLGFRITNYLARSLLETSGFRPRLHPDVRRAGLPDLLGSPRDRPAQLEPTLGGPVPADLLRRPVRGCQGGTGTERRSGPIATIVK